VPSDTTLDSIKSILLDALGALDAPTSFSALLRIPLSQPGKLLGDAPRPIWVQVVLAVCAATDGDPAIGARVAAAVEIFMTSLDLLDEIEDGDLSPTVEAAGVPQALNAATALLLLGQRLLLSLPSRPGLPTPVDFAHTLTSGSLIATGGQHLDLSAEGFAATSPDAILATARRKAGSLTGAACRLGAMVGTSDEQLLDLYSRWGTHYGTVAQLANDLHDALDPIQKSDVTRQKSTLPLIYNHRLSADTGASVDVPGSGALHFTWVVVEIERQACRELVDQLAMRGQKIDLLRQLVP
jgi:geranylgeranyl pyrophosphate synthase